VTEQQSSVQTIRRSDGDRANTSALTLMLGVLNIAKLDIGTELILGIWRVEPGL